MKVRNSSPSARERPRRTVAFVSFDAEEQQLFGSFAFTCRRDVEEANIVAVVNMDLLGRDAMDVVKDTILVGGTETAPPWRRNCASLEARLVFASCPCPWTWSGCALIMRLSKTEGAYVCCLAADRSATITSRVTRQRRSTTRIWNVQPR